MERAPVQPEDVELTTQVGDIVGVSIDDAIALRSMGITNVGKLIAHLPSRHERLQGETTIDRLTVDDVVTTRGEVTATRTAGFGRKTRFEAVMLDDTGRLDLVFFNQAYLKNKIHPGTRLRVQGKARKYKQGVQLANPRFEIIGDSEPGEQDARIRPVYPASERISSDRIERIVGLVLDRASEQIEEQLPEAYRVERSLPTLAQAYRWMHAPDDEAQVDEARRRLAYDELLLLQLGLQMRRFHLREWLRAPALKLDERIDGHIRERLPFSLTGAQERVVGEIARDLTSGVPTNRLVQGDVGSGKTAVAVYAMLLAVASGHQAALMAPTEILAEQHFASISAMLAGSRVRIELVTGALTPAERDAVRAKIEHGDVDIVVGTHALLTESVKFQSLALVVIDEQHRFGVNQRASLRSKAEDDQTTPHVLVMTATPIPRTVLISLLGDLDVSTIDELPGGRQPIETRIATMEQRADVYGSVRRRVDEGDQAYVVVPTIDTGASSDGELNDLRTVQAELEEGALQGKRVAALHGRLKRATREHVMERFRSGAIDVLVATTVIEVGVDVPNATVMVVEHADRFGLAQLHQLRGRVGRGSKKSVCVLIGDPATDDGAARLRVMGEVSDGFELAQKDLEIRGPGEIFGTRQSGLPPLRVADLSRDLELLAMARRDAEGWIKRSPALSAPEEAVIKRRLLKTYGEALGLGGVA